MAGATYQRESDFQAVERIVGVLMVLAVLCGGLLLSAGEARAQTLEDEPLLTDSATTEPLPSGDGTSEPASDDPALATGPSPTPDADPMVQEPAPQPAPTPVAETTPGAEPAPEPAPAAETTPIIEPTPEPEIVTEPAPDPVVQEPAPQSEPQLEAEIVPAPISVEDSTTAPELVVASEPTPLPDPAPKAEPVVDSAPLPVASEATPASAPALEQVPLEPTSPEEPINSLSSIEPAPVPAPDATLESAPVASSAVPVLPAYDEPVAAPAVRPAPVVLAAPDAEPLGGPPLGPLEDDGWNMKADAYLAVPVVDVADPAGPPNPPDTGGDVRSQMLGQEGHGAASLPQSLANRLIETAAGLFADSSEAAANVARRADRMATVLLRSATHLVEGLTDEQSAPAQPVRNDPSPAVPPAPAPVPVPVGGGAFCGSSGGAWECHYDSHYALLIGILAGAFTLGIPGGSARFFHGAFKPNSILPQVAERPG